jgi:sec-independent protein translocase protein TatC
MPGTGEMLLIALLAIIVVDPKKLPDLMKSLGKAIGEFKQMSGEFKRTIERETEMADFEKRKAEAHEQLYGTKAGADGQAKPDGEAKPAGEAKTDGEAASEATDEFAHPEQPPVERVEAAAEAELEAVAETPAEEAVEASADVAAAAEAVTPAEGTEAAEAASGTPADASAATAEEAAVEPVAEVPSETPSEIPMEAPSEPAAAATDTSTLPAETTEAGLPAEAEPTAVPAAAEGPGGVDVPPPPPPPAGDDAVGEGHAGRMSLFGHLQDLRKRLTRSIIAVLVGFLASYAFAGKLLKILMQPMLDAIKQSHFIYTLPTEAFFTEMKIAFVAGIFLCSPYIFYQIWQFIAPGLYSHERKWIIPIAFFSAVCFTIGAFFGYFVVFPFGFEFFASYTNEYLVFTPKLDEYLDFVLKLLFAFGIVFELPLFMFFLARLGIVTFEGLKAKRKYAILSAFIVAAALTPPDAISQTMMAVPLCVLYEVGVWMAFFFGKKRKPAPAEEPAAPTEAA